MTFRPARRRRARGGAPRRLLAIAGSVMALLVLGAAPASASYSFVVPVTVPETGQVLNIAAVTCGDAIEGTWLWSGRTEYAFTMPAPGGTFGSLDLLPAAAGTRTGPMSVDVTWRPDATQPAVQGTGTIVKGLPEALKGACRQECPLGGDVGQAMASQAPAACAKPWLTREAKASLGKVSDIVYGIGGLYTVVGGVLVVVPAPEPWHKSVGAGLLISAGNAAVAGAVLSYLSKDPPDQRFRELAKVEKPRVARVRARSKLSGRAARALNRMFDTSAEATGLRRALLTSAERAQGAQVYGQPGDETWQRQQMLAAAGHAKALVPVLGELSSRSRAAVRALKASGLRFKIGRGAVRRAQRRIARQGLPEAMVRQIKRSSTWRPGMADTTLDAVRRQIAGAKPGALGGRFPDKLASPELLQALRTEAQVMQEFAARAERNPLAPAS